ncbi:MAG: acetamidase/formamidase family protein [Erysipelotrichaceae bacterium]|nr:acetamidase/formamidase family protein [Erysipelotrichaceae bacterium]
MPKYYELKATPETCVWGYFDNKREPVLTVESGDIVMLESLTHHAGDFPDYVFDEGVRAVYDSIPEEERKPGVHIITGPIYVEGAEPGDVLEVKVLNMVPRVPYGVTFEANWGALYEEFGKTERTNLWYADMESGLAKVVTSYDYPLLCDVPGRIMPREKVEYKDTLKNVYVPLRLHFGTAGVAPGESGRINTIPPGEFGGNMDNRHFVPGTSMFYPVQVKGALFGAGDSHFTEGDAELCGTAIEGSVNATLQLILHKAGEGLKLNENPVLETPEYYAVHGLDRDLGKAMNKCALEAIDFLVNNKGLSRSEAYVLLSVAGDFAVTQVVDDVKGIHCIIPKKCFVPFNKGNI